MASEIKMNVQTKMSASLSLSSLSELAKARVVAVVFATVMVFTVGFAQSSPIHNAAHDTRHVQVFPCH
jgi:cobalt transporter subunit CbtB